MQSAGQVPPCRRSCLGMWCSTSIVRVNHTIGQLSRAGKAVQHAGGVMPCCSGYQCHVQVLVWAMHHVLGASHKAPTYTGISALYVHHFDLAPTMLGYALFTVLCNAVCHLVSCCAGCHLTSCCAVPCCALLMSAGCTGVAAQQSGEPDHHSAWSRVSGWLHGDSQNHAQVRLRYRCPQAAAAAAER